MESPIPRRTQFDMNESRFVMKVGVFVFSGLVLIALLILNFSKGITLFQSTYQLHVMMPTVAGLKPSADVMMAGVIIGKVARTELAPDGKSVNITIKVLSKFKIRKDATIHIDSLGFLGDQYIAVTPLSSDAPLLSDGATVQGEAPFDMQEAVRSTSGLLEQARGTLKDLDQAITNVNRTVLAEETLTNFSGAISNLESVTTEALHMANQIETLLSTNTPPVTAAISSLDTFSKKLNTMADRLDQVITNNSGEVGEAVKNFRDASASFKQVAADLQAGKGLAGGLLKDEQMKVQVAALLSNANDMASNFSTFGSNLNQRGVWSMLWKPKNRETK
jgi:phospholipid/cholesterol/gamma-HCH transport system substrate-binding protein